MGTLEVGDTAEAEPETLEDDRIVDDVLEAGTLDVEDVPKEPVDREAVLAD